MITITMMKVMLKKDNIKNKRYKKVKKEKEKKVSM